MTIEKPDMEDLYDVGIIAKVKQMVKIAKRYNAGFSRRITTCEFGIDYKEQIHLTKLQL